MGNLQKPKVYSEPWQPSRMESCVNVVSGFESWTIFAKISILEVWQIFKYASENLLKSSHSEVLTKKSS